MFIIHICDYYSQEPRSRSKPVEKWDEEWKGKEVQANSRADQMKLERAEAPERSSWGT